MGFTGLPDTSQHWFSSPGLKPALLEPVPRDCCVLVPLLLQGICSTHAGSSSSWASSWIRIILKHWREFKFLEANNSSLISFSKASSRYMKKEVVNVIVKNSRTCLYNWLYKPIFLFLFSNIDWGWIYFTSKQVFDVTLPSCISFHRKVSVPNVLPWSVIWVYIQTKRKMLDNKDCRTSPHYLTRYQHKMISTVKISFRKLRKKLQSVSNLVVLESYREILRIKNTKVWMRALQGWNE